jgi:hypothetical protein
MNLSNFSIRGTFSDQKGVDLCNLPANTPRLLGETAPQDFMIYFAGSRNRIDMHRATAWHGEDTGPTLTKNITC